MLKIWVSVIVVQVDKCKRHVDINRQIHENNSDTPCNFVKLQIVQSSDGATNNFTLVWLCQKIIGKSLLMCACD